MTAICRGALRIGMILHAFRSHIGMIPRAFRCHDYRRARETIAPSSVIADCSMRGGLATVSVPPAGLRRLVAMTKG
jgi:hypothetical protein